MSEQDTSSTLDTVDKLLSQAKNLLEKKNENLDIAATLMLVQAANMGSLEAKTLIGDLTFYGRCADKSLVEAVRWYGSAAEQGYAEAQLKLGKCYLYAHGVEKNYDKAFC